MPRPNKPRSMQNEANLARRIAYERGARHWTYKEVAARMTAAGCAMQPSAVQKIEATGGRPRKISVDELVAFASIFDTDVPGLLQPVEAVEEREAAALLQRVFDTDAEVRRACMEALRALRATREAAQETPGVAAFMTAALDRYEAVADPFGPPGDDSAPVAARALAELNKIAREQADTTSEEDE